MRNLRTIPLLLVTLVSVLLVPTQPAHAGGPRWVAGASYFDPSVKGHPIVWAGGKIAYFTDQGDLNAAVSQAQANAMVATAATVWSSVNTAAVSIQHGGSLAEDVNGTNVISTANGPELPADIQPTATSEPVAVVYDQDGSVIDAIYGHGASSSNACEKNGVFTTIDNFTKSANIAHALLLVNGLCATSAAQIATLQYQLVRAFGRVLGLDWSQANEEMFAASQVTTNGLHGWPIMHPIERLCSATSGGCIPNPLQLRTDDIAALNRLYPVTPANIAGFSGKVLTTSATISVTGRIQFGRGQGMQGVNVVLRPLVEGVPDARYTATAVSGALFRGNAGNPVTGTVDEHGKSLNRSGSDDLSLEGYFDLSGVPLPPGEEPADYQLTFEALNPLYTGSSSVGPYVSSQIRPSGTMPTINLGVLRAGSVAAQTVVIEDAAAEVQSGPDGDECAPASIPASGEWTGRLTGYGHTAWFSFHARASREFTIEAQPLDERGSSTDEKALIVIGAWNGVDAPGTLPVTATVQPFNGQIAGLTTLPVLMIADSDVRVGLADLRGDGRPDFAYRGRVLYAESVSPTRLPPAGGEIVIRGMGFRSSIRVSVDGVPATVVSVSPTVIVANAPPSGGITGTVALHLQDAQTLAVAVIADQLSYDSGTVDALSIITAPMNAVPIGIPQPFTIRAVKTGTDSPATGVTVAFSMTQGKAALACGLSTCTAITAGDGTVTLLVTPTSSEPAQVAASLSNGRSLIAEFTGTAPPSIAALTPSLYLAFGASVRWPVAAMVLNGAGTPAAGQSITWSAASQGVSFSAAQTTSSATGVVVNEISAGPFDTSVSVTVDACLTAKLACTSFELVPVHPRTAVLQPWNGTSQYVPANETFSPSVLHVTDAFGHPLAGAPVTVAEAFYGWTAGCPPQGRCPPAPLLAQRTRTLVSDLNGMVSFVPLSAGGLSGRLFVTASTAGPSALSFVLDAHP